ncbi:MAG: V-type ATPase subunit [bacterium]
MRQVYFEKEPTDQRYTYAAGLVRCFENSLLDKNKIHRMSEARDLQEVIRLLQDTPYGAYISGNTQQYDFEQILTGRRKEVYEFFDKYCLDLPGYHFIHAPFDYLNLKLVLKSQIAGKKLKHLFNIFGSIKLDVFKKYFSFDQSEQEFQQTPLSDEETVLEKVIPDHLIKCSQQVLEYYYQTKDPRYIDVIIDQHAYGYLDTLNDLLNSSFLSDLLQIEVDSINLTTYLRIQNIDLGELVNFIFLPGGRISPEDWNRYLVKQDEELETILNEHQLEEYTGVVDKDLWEAEKIKDQLKVELLRQARFFTTGLETLIGYVYTVEQEVKALRRIMIGKNNNVSKSKIIKGLSEVV